MAGLNRIILIGKLIEDPETKFMVDGTAMSKFKLAVDRFHKEGSPQATDTIEIIAWRKVAEIAGQSLKKGGLALVEGRIQVRSYEDQVGARKWVTEVVAKSLQPIGAKAAASASVSVQAGPQPSIVDEMSEDVPEEDDLPF